MESKNEKFNLMRIITHGEQPPNCDETLQIKATYAHNGLARGIWRVDEKFINGIGVAMGGFVSSAADIMMAYAIASKLEARQTFTSIDLHTTFHRPVMLGEVMVEARVERMGKKTAYVIADLYQNKKKAASVVSSVMILND
jgi:acyl-CoA thioesterase